jgi:hypothetical protein
VNTLPLAAEWLRANAPEVEAALARKNCPESAHKALVAWHERYAAEALRVAEEGLERPRVAPCMPNVPRCEIAMSKSYAAVSAVGDVDMVLLAMECFPGDDVVRGSARQFFAFAPEADVRAYFRQLHTWETRWIAALTLTVKPS